ncbi:3-isopropylmalate dehydratase small subunit [Pseudomonas sp. B21-054]|uniref:3-isopropylmalate dehydratase small subunit n=1 Tax=Pseudomonas sp. B21-054 TaxID=2895494 RepID=UPI00222F3661|nr:3-isopropylmalate dehydratase small subunit [Pseudomonas sp. B21-054]UZE15716.1 3-isopropylmalate dehydratase small subunit [Pseudomonas sp. B21-054]
MDPFIQVSGIAAPFPAANVDTDVIMPKQFLKGIDRSGLARGLFYDLRWLPDGTPDPDFILNRPGWQDARFLVVGPNFGCGSSREHAVWGLKQMGIRALIGTRFAGIFYDNCQRNGVLLIELDTSHHNLVMEEISQAHRAAIEIDLPAQCIRLSSGIDVAFAIDQLRKQALMDGLDAIGRTLQKTEAIRVFEARHLRTHPWLA